MYICFILLVNKYHLKSLHRSWLLYFCWCIICRVSIDWAGIRFPSTENHSWAIFAFSSQERSCTPAAVFGALSSRSESKKGASRADWVRNLARGRVLAALLVFPTPGATRSARHDFRKKLAHLIGHNGQLLLYLPFLNFRLGASKYEKKNNKQTKRVAKT